jgi:PAS domain S-box-containing protein
MIAQNHPAPDGAAWRYRDVTVFAGIIAAYVVGGAFGLSLAFVHVSATAVWPPTGIAIASLLLFGLRFWPAVFAGAFIVNVEPSGIAASIGIGVGNTAEAAAAAALVQRYAGGVRAFTRAADLFKYVLIAAVGAPTVAATVGVASLAMAGRITSASPFFIWVTWWIGDAIAACVIAPAIVVWGVRATGTWSFERAAEAALIGLVITLTALIVFAGWLPGLDPHYALEFVCIPPCLWCAYRFGPRGAATGSLLLSGIAIWGTLGGLGPFGREVPQNALPLLQLFAGVVAVASMTVGALASQSREADQEIRALNTDLERRVGERTAQLIQSEARLLEAQQVGHIGSWEWDIVGDRVWWSDELYRIYGVDPSRFDATYAGFLALVHPDDRAMIEREVRRALGDGDAFDFEHRVVWPDGAVRWLHGRGRVVHGRDGSPLRMVGTGLDITERKALEAERARLADVEADRRAAEDANRQKDEFLAVLSHELRTPLNAVLGWLQVLRTRALDPEVARTIDVVERNGNALRRIIDDLLDLSAIVSGKLRLETAGVNLDAELRGAIESVRPHAEARGLALDYRPCPDPIVVEADPHRLHQVLSNLLTNAVKFTPAGGCVTLSCERDEDHAVVTIADTGIGVPKDAQPHIFDPFRQADSSLTRGHGGLGLGLAIARHLIDLHGGTIRVDSEGDHQGTTFTVRLHTATDLAVESSRAGLSDDVSAAVRLLHGKRVVVIDDDPDARQLLAIGLTAAGASVATASSAIQGLQRVVELLPDVVLVDIAMPEMDGYEFLRELRRSGHGMPAIAVTAHAAGHDRQRAIDAGFHDHIAKPVNLRHLVETLHQT